MHTSASKTFMLLRGAGFIIINQPCIHAFMELILMRQYFVKLLTIFRMYNNFLVRPVCYTHNLSSVEFSLYGLLL